MNKKKNQIIWRRAKPPVTEKLSLTGNLTFDSRHSRLDGHPQLRDLNSYADISFKSSSTTMSKMRLDRESVTVFPGIKFRLNYEVKSTGQSIRVWNSVGEVFDQ
ncbi:uncharacterized protein LOC134822336 [Bolinopsis microptera]|uniref:uncharacterized protein LOC134822336 n=1 Tax=Bolinopsis microptera TaxID=2820187 RepID=UPI00307996D4